MLINIENKREKIFNGADYTLQKTQEIFIFIGGDPFPLDGTQVFTLLTLIHHNKER